MRWPFSRHRKCEQAEREQRLADAELEVATIKRRAEKVGTALERRNRRNQWSEAAAAIARREA